MWGWWWSVAAWAGSGPWVAGSGATSLYLGLDGQRFTSYRAGTEVTPLGEGVSTIRGIALLTYGVAPRVEVELGVPYHASHVHRQDAEVCREFGGDACADTNTIGVITGRAKALVVDELAGAPLSVAVGALTRFGGLVAPTRHRITNAGEGTMDVGPTVSLGRIGSLTGNGYWSVQLDTWGVYRVPNTARFPRLQGDRRVPGAEGGANLDLFVAPRRVVAVGPTVQGFARPAGVDFDAFEVNDPDRFAALRVLDVRMGLKALLRSQQDHVIVLEATHTVFALNQPADNLTLAVGIALHDPFTRRRD